MPTYDYECEACGHTFDHFQSMSSRKLRKCPECSKPKLIRLIGAGAGVIFKGSGFYETDYKRAGSSGSSDSSSESGDSSKSGESSESGESSKPESGAAGKESSAKGDKQSSGDGSGSDAASGKSSKKDSGSGSK